MLLGLELVVGLIALVTLLLWLSALIDALRRPSDQWKSAGQSQIVWVVAILLANVIGSLAYWLIARPQLQTHAA